MRMTKSMNISCFHAVLSHLCTQDKTCWDLMIPLGKLTIQVCLNLKAKYINTPTHTRINIVLISVCLLLIQQAKRRLCVLSEKSVYTASDLWRCCMQPKQRLWPLFPQFSPPLSVNRRWIEIFFSFFYSWCHSNRPTCVTLCLKNTFWRIFWHILVLEWQDFMHTTTQTQPESFDDFTPFIMYTGELPELIWIALMQ